MARQSPSSDQPDIKQERWALLEQIDAALDKPMIALAFVWLGLLILDFTRGLSPMLQTISDVIWGLFVLDFVLGFTIAPHKLQYMQRNWLTALSLMLPALRLLRLFRLFRVLRAARAVRSIGMIRLLTSLNRSMRAIGNVLGRRGIGFVIALTVIVTFGGAAGMYLFERPVTQDGVGLDTYGEAVWWTAMIMTTMGSEYWPQTVEGRVLGWLLAVYAFAIFGYITATIASFFVGQDAEERQGQAALDAARTSEAVALRQEVALLREQIAALIQQHEVSTRPITPSTPVQPTSGSERAK